MGDCLNDLSIEELKLLEEEMDKAAKVIRERKVRLCFYILYTRVSVFSHKIFFFFWGGGLQFLLQV